ncbi:MAG: peptide MFS transporter [bacterium]|nr:peptide MFS transporter [bacterium]
MKRSSFPLNFWAANTIEIFERFVYYGVYFPLGIYMTHLGFSRDELGLVQFIILILSYMIPIFSGTIADRYGFKKVLIISNLIYLPAIGILILTKSYSGIILAMLTMGFAAGIFKPLISGTVRLTTDKTNKTLGFGIFYAMVNVGGSVGPFVAGLLRAISWETAFYTNAAVMVVMLLFTIFFYKEPEREIENVTLGQKMREIVEVLSDGKFFLFLVLLGIFFWIPFWAFFNLCAVYVDNDLNTARLYLEIKSVLGAGFANLISDVNKETGVREVMGETIAHTGYIIVIFQLVISSIFEKVKAMSSFLIGLIVAAAGFLVLGYAGVASPSFVFLGIFLFAIGEMISSPRIQEYITWIAPKEKAGLYMGANFLAVGIGAFSALTYTPLSGYFNRMGHPEYVWYVLAVHLAIGTLALFIFTKKAGEFTELEE